MAKQSASRLKVFQAQIGFFDSVVAAPSQAAALRAWGSSQNLFAQGLAQVTTDAETVKSALMHPGTPLRRALGSSEPFSLKPAAPKIEALEPEPVKPKAKRPPPVLKVVAADRRDLDAAEAALAALDATHKRQDEEFDRRRQALVREAAALARREAELAAEAAKAKAAAAERRARALQTIAREKEVYRRQGGRD